jgi:nucleotide-binding universal stress UspA family protein
LFPARHGIADLDRRQCPVRRHAASWRMPAAVEADLATWEDSMIKDVMVRLDGTKADETRLAAVNEIAERFNSHIVGLFFNPLPIIYPEDGDDAGAIVAAELIQKARETGDVTEAKVRQRLARLQKPSEIRRFDVLLDGFGPIAADQARAADVFVELRPNGAPQDPEKLVEGVLFGSGRHLLLVPDGSSGKLGFDRVLLAWNGSRECARALSEAKPYLLEAEGVSVVVVDASGVEEEANLGKDAVKHLKHHGIRASLHYIKSRDGNVGAALIDEAKRMKADLIVMGGYGHSRLREWLLGGTTYEMMHHAPMPLLIAH